MKSITTTLVRAALTPSSLLFLSVLTIISLIALCNVKISQARAEVQTGQYPKEKIARQAFSTTDGKKITLEGLRGKVVIMQFFGTWCGYSKRQVMAINKLLENGNPTGLEVVGMAVKDPRSSSQAVKQFIGEQKVGYSVVSGVDDKFFVDFVNSTDVSVPQTLIYGRDGRLLAHFKGFNQQVGTEIEARIKSELALSK